MIYQRKNNCICSPLSGCVVMDVSVYNVYHVFIFFTRAVGTQLKGDHYLGVLASTSCV